ncbi:SH3 domain-containing protein [Chamaesiphon minutus]|uniref:SH3 domain-containing protein n=1 Tax=Chamaesiphon minutus (strain ATCC 27169 / PCC 6605) TaxID=1173020 RepID=K9UNE4_CHAP6|nr:SH3 domain-containing protein [Chamaesiphon minutus]AFY96627.1 SH3 domain-containing protein [Chamaesiphon minutus PCC 6605]
MKLQSLSTAICLAVATSTISLAPAFAQSGPGNYGGVSTVYSCSRDGDPVNLRARAGQQSRVIGRIPPGRSVVLIGNARVAGGYTWRKVNFFGAIGWVRGDFLCS